MCVFVDYIWKGIYLWRTAGYSFPDLSHFRQKKSLCKFSGSIQLCPPKAVKVTARATQGLGVSSKGIASKQAKPLIASLNGNGSVGKFLFSLGLSKFAELVWQDETKVFKDM